MLFVVANTDPVPLTDIFRLVLLYAILAEVVGIPVAWLRVRKQEAWLERPEEEGRLRTLSVYIAQITGLIVAWGALIGICTFIGSRL
ncbi:MAG: hypothetical protein WD827_07430 [Solirubrobacterales bacterium]